MRFRACSALLPVMVCVAAACSGSDDGGWAPSSAGDGAADAAQEEIQTAKGGAGGAPDAAVGGAGGSAGDAATEAQSEAGEAATAECVVMGVSGECVEVTACEGAGNHTSTAGLCPGPEEVQCCTPFGVALCDPAVLVLPNAGNTTEAPGQGGCPSGMIPVDTFCVDQYEASLVQVSDGASWSPYLNPGAAAVRAVSVKGAVPQGYINGEQAAQACANAGKRLCTDAEWLRACQGPAGLTYPYGDTVQEGVCNDHRDEHPAVQYFGTTDSWIYSELDNACLNQLPMSVAPCGARGGCVSADGAYDLMGNLHEWTSDPAGTFRGGFYVDTILNGPGCSYATTAHNTLHWDYSTGFRCCAD